MILIGISGKKGSGKNTIATFIEQAVKEYCKDIDVIPVVTLAFADPLKDEVCKACGVTRDYLEQNKSNFRLILQGWGTEFRRRLQDDNYWIKQWLKAATKISDDTVLLVPDCRFKNEYNTIKDCGGLMWRVERVYSELAKQHSDVVLNSNDNHPSETELDNYKFDETINNNHTLNSLEFIVKEKTNSILKKYYGN